LLVEQTAISRSSPPFAPDLVSESAKVSLRGETPIFYLCCLDVWIAMHEDLRTSPPMRIVFDHLTSILSRLIGPKKRTTRGSRLQDGPVRRVLARCFAHERAQASSIRRLNCAARPVPCISLPMTGKLCLSEHGSRPRASMTDLDLAFQNRGQPVTRLPNSIAYNLRRSTIF
jgi:hypothetical protein